MSLILLFAFVSLSLQCDWDLPVERVSAKVSEELPWNMVSITDMMECEDESEIYCVSVTYFRYKGVSSLDKQKTVSYKIGKSELASLYGESNEKTKECPLTWDHKTEYTGSVEDMGCDAYTKKFHVIDAPNPQSIRFITEFICDNIEKGTE